MSILVEVFASPGCSKCGRTKKVLQAIAADIGDGRVELRQVDVIEELDYAVRLGVRSTPAIAFDGRLTFTGLTPARDLRAELQRRLAADDEER